MATDPDTTTTECHVCGQTVDSVTGTECNWCSRRFHLNQRNDIDAKDCGEVWIDEQYLALQFACNDCLRADGAGERPDVERVRTEADVVRPRRYKRRS